MVSSGNPAAIIRLGQTSFATLGKLLCKSLIKMNIYILNTIEALREHSCTCV